MSERRISNGGRLAAMIGAFAVAIVAIIVCGSPGSDTATSKPAAAASSAQVHKIPTGRPPGATPWPQSPATDVTPETLTDAQVDAAIRRGVGFLIGQYKNGHVAADPKMSQNWRE